MINDTRDNYARLEQELRSIRRRLSALERKDSERIAELEDTVFAMNRTIWRMQNQEKEREISAYLENYSPKKIKDGKRIENQR